MGFVKNLILGISIAIIFAFFVGFGIQASYPEPEYEDFCKDVSPNIEADSCPKQMKEPFVPRYDKYSESCWCERDCSDGPCVDTDECYKTNPEYTACQEAHDDAKEKYEKNVFLIATIVGLIVMIIGGFLLKHESVSPGLMGGGFFTILYGVIRYWQHAADWLRFIILGLILAMLIYMGYKKFTFIKK